MSELKPFSSHLSLKKGEVVYRLDEPANALFRIEMGRAKVIRISAEGQEKIVGLYSAGEIFGELCVCDAASRRDQAVAVEPLELTAIDVNGLLKFIGQKPEISQEFLRLLCARLSDCQEQVATLSFDTVARRLAKELMKLGAAGQRQRSDGSCVASGLTHEDLASLIGTTREVITALMNQFRERGLIEYGRGSIVVFPNELAKYLKQASG
jgi:CRP/FNR family transcriptional regulator